MLDHSLLLTDLYQLSMMEVYARHEMQQRAVFELFVRKLPVRRSFLMMAGLEQPRAFPRTDALFGRGTGVAAFQRDVFVELRRQPGRPALHRRPRQHGEGLPCSSPTSRSCASPRPCPWPSWSSVALDQPHPLPNRRRVDGSTDGVAAPGKALIDFGFRRAHGAEAGLLGPRAAYVAGFAGTATLAANRVFGVPVFGTMAHSFIQAHDDEAPRSSASPWQGPNR